MNIDLFDQTLQFAVYGLAWAAVALSAVMLWQAPHRGRRRIAYKMYGIVGGALILSIATWAIVQSQFSQDDIPTGGILWVMPVYVLLGFLAVGIRSARRSLVAGGGIVFALVLCGLIVNNYYHYFSTPAALLQSMGVVKSADVAWVGAGGLQTAKPTLTLEQFYQAPPRQAARGQLATLKIPSSNSSFAPREGRIYLPPALNGNDLISLPVVVLLAGYPGKPTDWEQAGLLNIMNDFAAKHKGLAPIVAVVDFAGEHDVDTECVDSKLGSAETYLTKDVPAYLKAHYQVVADASQWTIGGYSAGGTCGSLVAIRNPGIYQNFMNISGDALPSLATNKDTLDTLFGGSIDAQRAHTPDLLLEAGNPKFHTMHAWYYYAESDKPLIVSRIKAQAALAEKAGIDTQLRSMKGHHSFEVWKQGYVDGLPWLMNALRLTQSQ